MKILLAFLCILFGFSMAKQYEAINRCISDGEIYAKTHKNCHHIPPHLTQNMNPKYHQLCINSFKIACIGIINDNSCEKGIEIAKLNDNCDDHESLTVKKCCTSCKFGLVFKSIFNHCDFSSIKLNSSELIRHCCDAEKEILNDETQSAKTLSCLKHDLCSDGEMCIDDDNSENSFRCDCNDGYERVAETKRCEDIDECKLNKHNCTVSEICKNDIGSFRCEKACLDGYKAVIKNSRYAEEIKCIDINECEQECADDKKCVNLLGSHRCEQIKCEKFYIKLPSFDICYRQHGTCEKSIECNKQFPRRYHHFFMGIKEKITIKSIDGIVKENYKNFKILNNEDIFRLDDNRIEMIETLKEDKELKVKMDIYDDKNVYLGHQIYIYHIYVNKA